MVVQQALYPLSSLPALSHKWLSLFSISLIPFTTLHPPRPQTAAFSSKNWGLWYEGSFIFLPLCFSVTACAPSPVCAPPCCHSWFSSLWGKEYNLSLGLAWTSSLSCACNPTPFFSCQRGFSVWTTIFKHFLSFRDFQSSATIVFEPSCHAYIQIQQ